MNTFWDDDWKGQAACRGIDEPEIFFEESRWPEAVLLCQLCPVRRECLEAAIWAERSRGNGFVFGIFGGMTPRQRIELRSRASPRKPA